MAEQSPTQRPEEEQRQERSAINMDQMLAALRESSERLEAMKAQLHMNEPVLFSSSWFAGALRDYGAIVGFFGVIVTLTLFAIPALTNLGKLQANVKTLQTEFTRMRDTQTAQVKSLASLNAGMQQLNSTIEKQTTVLDLLRDSMADNTAAIQHLAQAIDRLTIKLSDVERTANDNKSLLSRLDERTKG